MTRVPEDRCAREVTALPARDVRVGIALGIISVLVPLVPFRYLALPRGVAVPWQAILGHFPVGLCLVATAAAIFVPGKRRVGGAVWRGDWRRIPLAGAMLVMLLGGVLSALGARQPLLSVSKTAYYFLTGPWLYVMAASLCSAGVARRVLLCLLVAGYTVAAYGIMEHVAGANDLFADCFTSVNDAYRRLAPDPWWEGRITSTVGHPVVLGTYLALLLPVSLTMTVAATARAGRLLWVGGTALLSAALLLTFSRGAWVAAAVGMLVFAARSGVRRRITVRIVGVLLVGVVLAVGGSNAVRGKATQRLRAGYRDYVLHFGRTTRGIAYGYVAVIADRHPLTGLGAGMYRFAAYDLRRRLAIPTPVGVLDTPDNMYLVWLAENGAVGLGLAVYVLASLLQRFRQSSGGDRAWKEGTFPGDASPSLLSAGFLGACAALSVDLFTVDGLYFPVVRMIFWILAGVGVVLVRPAGIVVEGTTPAVRPLPGTRVAGRGPEAPPGRGDAPLGRPPGR